MPALEQLLLLIDRFCEAADLSAATVSTKLFNDGKRIAMLRAGGDIGTRQFAKAVGWFADNWPDGAQWPDDVARPVAQEAAPSEAAE